MTMEQYHAEADDTMEQLLETLEDLLETSGERDYEVDYHVRTPIWLGL